MRVVVAVLTALATLALGGGVSAALDARAYWPNFDAVSKGYYLKAIDGSGLGMKFTTFDGIQNFRLADESGCNTDYYSYAHGWLWGVYSSYVCDGLWIEQWYARPPNLSPQEIPRQIGPVSSGISNKVFLDRNGSWAGSVLKSVWRTYITDVEPRGVHFVSDQIWYDADDAEVGGMRETFLVGDVPLCEDGTRAMPGVRRYTTGNHRTVPETTYRETWFCWGR